MPADKDRSHVTLPRYLYERLQEYATLREQTIDEVLEAFIAEGLHGHDGRPPQGRMGASGARSPDEETTDH